MTACNAPLRTGPCALEEGHRGRHSTVAFYCEGCGKMRRGAPHAVQHVYLGDGTIDDTFTFCFVCAALEPSTSTSP